MSSDRERLRDAARYASQRADAAYRRGDMVTYNHERKVARTLVQPEQVICSEHGRYIQGSKVKHT